MDSRCRSSPSIWLLNVVVIGWGLIDLAEHPSAFAQWSATALARRTAVPSMMIVGALIVFPKLALGLSGFETGVAVMPLVKGDPGDIRRTACGPDPQHAKKLLTVAALT